MGGEEWLDRLIKARKDAGINARQLSLRIGMSPGYVQRCELRRSIPSVETAEKWLNACGLTVEVNPAEVEG